MQTTLLFLGNMGWPEIMLIFAVILIFFGAKRIPEIARGMGRGIREFKDATREIKNEMDEGAKDQPAAQQPLKNQTTVKESVNEKSTN